MVPNLLVMHLVFTLGFDFVPLEFGVRYTLGLLRFQWKFFYSVFAEMLQFNFEGFRGLDMMETVSLVKNVDVYGHFNWDDIFQQFGV